MLAAQVGDSRRIGIFAIDGSEYQVPDVTRDSIYS